MKAQDFIKEYSENTELRKEIRDLADCESPEKIMAFFEEKGMNLQDLVSVLQDTTAGNQKLGEQELQLVGGGSSRTELQMMLPIVNKLARKMNKYAQKKK